MFRHMVFSLSAGASACRQKLEQPTPLARNLRHQYGLDRPLWQQFTGYLAGVLMGDFGLSYRFASTPVIDVIEGERVAHHRPWPRVVTNEKSMFSEAPPKRTVV